MDAVATKTKDQEAFEKVQVGDIFVSSWGYDQTNIDFYQVVGKTKARIRVIGISKRHLDDNNGPQTKVVPNPKGNPNGLKGSLKKVYNAGWREDGEIRPAFSVNSFSSAYAWDGKPESETGRYYGH